MLPDELLSNFDMRLSENSKTGTLHESKMHDKKFSNSLNRSWPPGGPNNQNDTISCSDTELSDISFPPQDQLPCPHASRIDQMKAAPYLTRSSKPPSTRPSLPHTPYSWNMAHYKTSSITLTPTEQLLYTSLTALQDFPTWEAAVPQPITQTISDGPEKDAPMDLTVKKILIQIFAIFSVGDFV